MCRRVRRADMMNQPQRGRRDELRYLFWHGIIFRIAANVRTSNTTDKQSITTRPLLLFIFYFNRIYSRTINVFDLSDFRYHFIIIIFLFCLPLFLNSTINVWLSHHNLLGFVRVMASSINKQLSSHSSIYVLCKILFQCILVIFLNCPVYYLQFFRLFIQLNNLLFLFTIGEQVDDWDK